MKHAHRWLVLCLGWCLLASGCVSTQFTAPTLNVVSVGMLSADVFAQQFRIRLHVHNPNNKPLPIKAIDYELYLQGDAFAEGATTQAFEVPALGDAEFDTVVTTNFVSSIGRLLSKINSADEGKVQYAFIGNVQLSRGLMRKIPFKEQGMVSLALKK